MATLLEQAVTYIKAGNTEKGKQLLAEAIMQNPRDENAWLWMSKCVSDIGQKRDCFERVLKLNPQNPQAIEGLRGLNNPALLDPQPGGKPINARRRRASPLLVIRVLASTALCIGGLFVMSRLLNSLSASKEATARVLSAEDVLAVSAIDAAKQEGYTLASAVCETVSSERYLPTVEIDGGQIVFHAFRITNSARGYEGVVVFASNHTAAQGSGLVWSTNADAKRLFPQFPDSSKLSYPITMTTDGAQSALVCAQQAGKPPSLEAGSLDVEAWRRKAIEKFGPEQTHSDGSKDDYVRLAVGICKLSNTERASMKTNLGATYEGSIQQFTIETFCPYVK
jgi:hypothetical protein